MFRTKLQPGLQNCVLAMEVEIMQEGKESKSGLEDPKCRNDKKTFGMQSIPFDYMQAIDTSHIVEHERYRTGPELLMKWLKMIVHG